MATRSKRLREARSVLQALGLPREQVNERSALTLLALLDLSHETNWADASSPLKGITPIMDFARDQYRKAYAPNTRETFRRFTMHQFVEAGVALLNPDNPERPTNSPKTVYQIEPSALSLLRQFGTGQWEASLKEYVAVTGSLRAKYADERDVQRIPLRVAHGKTIALSPGGQNVLVERIITEFVEIFTPNATPVYVGDTHDKYAYFDREALSALGVSIDSHGKMPDVIVHDTARDWLLLIEAVTSHGPINPKRKAELANLFSGSSAAPVFVTAFLTRRTFLDYFSEIAWETEVWIAEAPTHMIHFNGERFLGPY